MTDTEWTSHHVVPEWVDGQDRMDRMLAPFGERLLAAAGLAAGDIVLDIGCGTGSTTLAAWQQVAPTGSVTGVDIAPAMLAAARRRLDMKDPRSSVRLVRADAGTYPFRPAS